MTPLSEFNEVMVTSLSSSDDMSSANGFCAFTTALFLLLLDCLVDGLLPLLASIFDIRRGARGERKS